MYFLPEGFHVTIIICYTQSPAETNMPFYENLTFDDVHRSSLRACEAIQKPDVHLDCFAGSQ